MPQTLVVSDLHLGSRSGSDVLRHAGAVEALIAALDGVDRLVLLGDTLELRHDPPHQVLDRARGMLRTLGQALGGRTVVIVPGNHDHALGADWFAGRTAPFTLEQRCAPRSASAAAGELAALLAPAAVEVAYPGLWLADGVYATHGHYLDVHMTVPTMERIALAVSGRVALNGARRWDDARTVADYEAVITPVYAWVDAAARTGRASETIHGGRTIRAWDALAPGRPRVRSLRELPTRALPALFPLAVGTLNAAGLGPLRSELSMEELRRAGLRAMSEVVERLRIDARHVIFGHTHRAGMLPDDQQAEWLTPNGVRLHNTGSWVYSTTFASGAESPYWPGSAVLVADGVEPRLLRLLDDRSPTQLDAGVRTLTAPGRA